MQALFYISISKAQQILHYVAGTDASRIGLVAHMLNAITEEACVRNERDKNHKVILNFYLENIFCIWV